MRTRSQRRHFEQREISHRTEILRICGMFDLSQWAPGKFYTTNRERRIAGKKFHPCSCWLCKGDKPWKRPVSELRRIPVDE